MPRARTKLKKRSRKHSKLDARTQQHIRSVFHICVGALLLLSYTQGAGIFGRSVNAFLTFFFGAWGFLLPAALIVSGASHWLVPKSSVDGKRAFGLAICLFSFLGIVHLGAPLEEIAIRRDELGGALGFLASLPFFLFMSPLAGYVFHASALLIGFLVAFEPNMTAIGSALHSLFLRHERQRKREVISAEEEDFDDEDEESDDDLVEQDTDSPELNIVRPLFAQQVLKEKAQDAIRQQAVKEKLKNVLEMKDTRFEEWTFPTYDLLQDAVSQLTVDDEELKRQARLIEEKLQEFDIEVTVRDARPGPTVTQFTLQPAEGVKLSKIANLKDDLSLALAAPSLRIEAPIPGKSLVGIEMPNTKRTMVHLKEILESASFSQSSSSLTLPLGRDVSGEAIVANLETMPHLLIAGATGSGKSVCMNTFLTALLFQNAPHELKFILVDPKRVELMPYDGIPHLLTPVITEAERALQALRWAVAEMGRRLHRFSEAGARNLDEFNEKQTEENALLPRIVIVIDELADLMMRQFRRDTEMMITRIAQMARAVGMHLIIATQRPSVDVITGLIKANIPTRMAFRVVSAVDSRTILDGIGAEDLLGQGDMLHMTASTPKPVRIQGIYVSTKEVERVINAVKIAGGGRITEQIGLQEEKEEGEDGGEIDEAAGPRMGTIDLEADDNGGDDMFFDAVRVVQQTGKASASLLQRQLKVGYARAARLLDIMFEKGLIGPTDGVKARKVYMEKTSV